MIPPGLVAALAKRLTRPVIAELEKDKVFIAQVAALLLYRPD